MVKTDDLSKGWWEYKGKKKKLPANLAYSRSGLDKRFRSVKKFLANPDWKFYNPVGDFYNRTIVARMAPPLIVNKSKSLKFNH